ncbi:nucleolar protein 12-like isoform X2 [Acanthaster planci]|uniref:Nucleolar protein 12 n=1 Tax=Acanthaster planci TaxID=133434 RepID=A0A8B7XHS9_ACAPL|nr:nucleolar protein 12-like isoform X2 [Acanthaster planci]
MVDFLTGFQKRKKERKRVAREQQELKLKEEKQKLRQETRKARQAGWRELHFPDEDTPARDKQPIVYDHAEHTVTVESVGGVTVEALDLLAAHGGIGENKMEYEDDDDAKEPAQSRLKALAEYEDEDDESDEDDKQVPEEREYKQKNPAKKKSSKLQKLQSKLNRKKLGHRGGSSARHKGGLHKGAANTRGVKRLKTQGRHRGGGYGAKRR